jgi:hypothetical protein
MDLVTYFRIRTSLDFLVILVSIGLLFDSYWPALPTTPRISFGTLVCTNPSSGVSLVVIWIQILPRTACTTHIGGSSLYTQFTAL